MTMPADVTTAYDWDRLVLLLRALYRQVDQLYQRITDPELEDANRDAKEDTVTDPDRDYDADTAARDAELEQERLDRLDYETDGRLDGDYDRDEYDEPGLDA